MRKSGLAVLDQLGTKAEAAPFLGAISLFVLTYIGMAISLFPMIVPYQVTLWEAASSPRTRTACPSRDIAELLSAPHRELFGVAPMRGLAPDARFQLRANVEFRMRERVLVSKP